MANAPNLLGISRFDRQVKSPSAPGGAIETVGAIGIQ
jgi:hypothetical protein